jgi:hypothetical protein
MPKLAQFTVSFFTFAILALLVAFLALASPTRAGDAVVRGEPVVPLGNCQLSATQLSASVGLSVCTRSAFTGTGSGTNLTTTSVTGVILKGDTVSGTGVPAGTTIVSQTSGTAGGAGVYVTSAATTSSGASLTSGGIPPGATMAYLQGEVADVRWRDDGGAPTTAIGNLIHGGTIGTNFPGLFYRGTLSQIRFIGASGSPLLNVAFYR